MIKRERVKRRGQGQWKRRYIFYWKCNTWHHVYGKGNSIKCFCIDILELINTDYPFNKVKSIRNENMKGGVNYLSRQKFI
jgi:hypothetical protein